MKYFFLFLFCIMLGTFLGLRYSNVLTKSYVNSAPFVSQKLPQSPQQLIIPAIFVKAEVEKVGLDPQRKMESPKAINNVGWYSLGVKPGEIGNAVMAGHLDAPLGPAVFVNLFKLKKEDLVIVVDDQNQQFNFRVVKQEVYDFDKVPMREVFGLSNSSNLNLITCTGWFDNRTKNYSQRLVVFTTLKP